MSTLSASLLASALCFAAMAALAFAMDRHHAQLTQQHEVPRRRRLVLRGGAMALLALALASCIAGWGGSVGSVAFIGFLSLGALPVALLLPYRPRLLPGLALVLTLGAAAFACTGAS
ncbi:DUF3325 family protein [Variovorax sp. J22P168]|uniref:DUF3325 family protein n=1 Tax=Variovorax jilinensis TaxID=3053513 RepID=UPI002578E201|nr:DUF3325 family protein [Variovorax sp. J22P168]MDM0014726.1 DUF3325 family protein [Variovorax sp. J22P168]